MDRKKIFTRLSFIDIAIMIAIAVLIPLVTFFAKEDIIDALSSILALYCLYFAAKGNIIGFIFGVCYGAVFGFVCLNRGLYALTIMNWLYTMPMQLICLFVWLKNRDNGVVKARRLSTKWRFIGLGIVVLVCAIITLILMALKSNFAVIDSLVTVLQTISLLLLLFRFEESWWISVVAYFANIILWIISLANGASAVTLLITTIISFAFAVRGVVVWIKLTKLSNKKTVNNTNIT